MLGLQKNPPVLTLPSCCHEHWCSMFMYLSQIAPTLASRRAPPTCAGKELSSGRGRRLLPPGHLLPLFLLLLLLLLPLLLPLHSLPHLNHHSHHHCCLPTSPALLTFTAAADHLGIWRAQSQLALGGSSLCNALPPTTRPETTPVSWRPVRPPWARPPLQPPSTSWIPGLSAPRPNPLPPPPLQNPTASLHILSSASSNLSSFLSPQKHRIVGGSLSSQKTSALVPRATFYCYAGLTESLWGFAR